MENSNDATKEPASASAEPQKCAPAHELPTAHFYSIEYPGYVRPESVSKAVDCLGGQASIDRAFRRNAPKEDSLLELNLRHDDPFSHPLPGDLVPTNNVLLRVVKRRRLKRPRTPNDEDDDNDDGLRTVVGEYTAVAVGTIPKTARFRSEHSFALSTPRATPRAEGHHLNRGMADFQYQPPQDDPLSKLRSAMTALDGQRRFSSSPPFPASACFGDNSGGHPGVPVPARNGGLHHHR
jgi:general transcription factor 3C polypeptide 5 (transcription factor C subunit 1)